MTKSLITSTQNPKVKHLIALQQKSQLRRKEGIIVVEGARELSHCIHSGFKADTVFYCPALFNIDSILIDDAQLIEVSQEVYNKIAYRGSTEGVIAIVHARQLTLDDLALGENPLIIVLEGVEKPGNIGAVLRSADAAQQSEPAGRHQRRRAHHRDHAAEISCHLSGSGQRQRQELRDHR